MVAAKAHKRNPREIAQAIVAALAPNPLVARTDIAGAGFINIALAPAARQQVVARVLAAGDDFGRAGTHRGERVMVEFVSANPTGPLHVGHGRQAVLGDAIASLLEAQGHAVTREFYYNDAGAQIDNLALSVRARIREAHGAQRAVPRGRLPRRIHPRARRALRRRAARRRRRPRRDPPLRRGRAAPRAGRGPARDRRALRQLLPRELALHRWPRRAHGGGARRVRPHVRGGRRAVAAHHRLRRRQGPRDAQVRRQLHVLRAGRRLSRGQVRARLSQGGQRAGLGPPQHRDARARRPAGAWRWASRRDIPTTCCTRWCA